jgi:hypothetical protein
MNGFTDAYASEVGALLCSVVIFLCCMVPLGIWKLIEIVGWICKRFIQ